LRGKERKSVAEVQAEIKENWKIKTNITRRLHSDFAKRVKKAEQEERRQLATMKHSKPRGLEEVVTERTEIEESEEFERPVIRKTYPRRRYIWWTIEDGKLFSIYEMRLEQEGYCEECSNYGTLLYLDGLCLCENCREYVRVSRLPFKKELNSENG